MDMAMLKETLQRELPELLRADPGFREYLLELMRRDYPTRAETQDRFYEMLGELHREREERSREWREYQDKQDRKWDEQKAEDRRKWDEQNRKWQESGERFDHTTSNHGAGGMVGMAGWGIGIALGNTVGNFVSQRAGRDSGTDLWGASGQCQ